MLQLGIRSLATSPVSRLSCRSSLETTAHRSGGGPLVALVAASGVLDCLADDERPMHAGPSIGGRPRYSTVLSEPCLLAIPRAMIDSCVLNSVPAGTRPTRPRRL